MIKSNGSISLALSMSCVVYSCKKLFYCICSLTQCSREDFKPDYERLLSTCINGSQV